MNTPTTVNLYPYPYRYSTVAHLCCLRVALRRGKMATERHDHTDQTYQR